MAKDAPAPEVPATPATNAVTISLDDLKGLLETASKGGAASVMEALGIAKATPSADRTPDEAFAQTMRDQRPSGPALDVQRVPCKSENTEATFTALVLRGTVIDLAEYTHPQGVEMEQQAGGLAPNGMPKKTKLNGSEISNPAYDQWLWETYWQADIRTYNGKALRKGAIVAQASA